MKGYEEKTVFYNYVAACTMGEHHRNWGMDSGYWKSTCLCSSGCLCNETFVSAEDSLGVFMRRDVIESLRNWEAVCFQPKLVRCLYPTVLRSDFA